MDLRAPEDTESRFVAYVEGLVSVIGHATGVDRYVDTARAW